MKLIGLCGLAGSGKTTIAQHLVEHHGFVRLPFAGPLKAMAAAFGLSPRELAGDLKEQPCEALCGKTPRQFMQWLGTEFGRDMIGPDVWVRAWERQLGEIAQGSFGSLRIVVDDLRFPNEAEVVRRRRGVIVRLIRDGAGSTSGSGHPSEALSNLGGEDICNNSAVPRVANRILTLVE